MKKGQVGAVVLGGIIAVIIGVAMIPVLASLIDEAQDVIAGNQQITASSGNQSITLDFDDLVPGSAVVLNATGSSAGTPEDTLREGSEYSLNDYSGVIVIINRTGTFNVSANYEPGTYVNTATGRTIVRNITLMYAVALILITLASVGITLYKR